MDFTNLLDFTVETAFLAGKITLGFFQTNLDPEIKKDGSFVTEADKKTELFIRQRIIQAFPDHEIVGEEFGKSETGKSDYRWFIDPIDGTWSFVHGAPLYAVLIGLEYKGEICAGAACYPALNDMLYAQKGGGCYWNGVKASVSETKTLDQSFLLMNDSENFPKYGKQKQWDKIKTMVKKRRGWGDAYGYLMVATGRADIMLDPAMNEWDCGPFPVILKEAGGYFGDWKGNRTIYGGEAVATNSYLEKPLLEALSA